MQLYGSRFVSSENLLSFFAPGKFNTETRWYILFQSRVAQSIRDTNKIYDSLEAIVYKNKLFQEYIFFKLNANQIGDNLLSIYLVPLSGASENLASLFSIYMTLAICCFFKNHSTQSFLIHSMNFDKTSQSHIYS